MKTLFVNLDTIKRSTILGGNIDADKLLQWVEIAQESYLHEILGTDLYTKLINGIDNNNLTSDEEFLIETYLQPILIHRAAAEAMPFLSYNFSNGGVYKRSIENGEIVDKDEVDFLVQKARNIADMYTERYLKYMAFNAPSKFPSYYTNTNEDVYPDKSDNAGSSWVF